ncbi:MAG: TonB-dependent receptor [Sphingomonadaceae bacterium]
MIRMFKSTLLAATVLAPCAAYAQGSQSGDDIIVTARKKEETLQGVPTTVAVTTADVIDRLAMDSVTDIARITPGLIFDDSFGRDANRPVIRGQANILGDSGVAYFIDGIYYSGSIADYDVDSIERIEVIKGPQSALYGRNTYSGAINIISKMPSREWEGRAQADFSEHGRYELSGSIRGPIADGLGLGLSGRYFDNPGEFRNAFDGSRIGSQNSWSLGSALRFDNGGAFRASARVAYTNTNDGQPAIFHQDANQNNCLPDNGTLYRGAGRYYCGVVRPGTVSSDYKRQFAGTGDVGYQSKLWNASLRLDYDLGENVTLSSLTGYNHRRSSLQTDGDYSAESFQTAVFATFPLAFTPAPPPRNAVLGIVNSTIDFSFAQRSVVKDWSQELRLAYTSDMFDVLVGGYYFDQSDDGFDIRTVPFDGVARATAQANARRAAVCAASPICLSPTLLTAISLPNSRDENLIDRRNAAVFGAVTWHISDAFELSVEGRYASERVTQTVFDFNQGQARPAPNEVRATFKKFTPRAVASWQITPDNLIYGIYSEGQKPGGFNSVVAINAGVPTYAAEDVRSFELGSKNVLAGGLITANLAIFRNEIKGYQLTQNVAIPPNTTSAVVNAGDARINGLEMELALRPARGITLTGNYALAATKFTRGLDEQQGVLNDVADDGLVNCSTGDQFPGVAGCQSLFGSIAGKRIPRAPKHSLFFDADFRTPLGAGEWELFVGGNVSYTSSSFAQVHNLAETGSATVLDVRAGLQHGQYKVQFYGKNLTDEDSVQQLIRYADANNDLRRSFIGGLRPGRRFGIILSAGF